MSPVHIEPTEAQRSSEFAKLFDESTKRVTVKQGQIVKGRIVGLTRDYVVIDIGFKSEGQIPVEEFKNPKGEITAKEGDEIEVLLETIENEKGMMILSKERADAMRTWDLLTEVSENDGEIEGTVVAKVKGGLSVDIGVRAFLPGSQVDLRPARNLEKYVGNAYKFKIIKLNKRRGNVVLSRKVILEKEREAMREETLANLAEGQVFDGIVKNVTDYGVFIDLGGIDGLLHVTDMTWGRINHPSDMFSVGDEIRVVVLKFDTESQKVSLGLKQLMPDPWVDVDKNYPVGSRVTGKVVSLTDYGAFVALHDGVEGLIHVSEMSWTKKIKHPSKVVTAGDTVDAIVLDVDIDAKRISLGLKQTEPNPWDKIEESYPIGSKIKGGIRNIADFGIFVDVNGEIDGLVHISDIAWVQNFAHPSELFEKGQEVEAVVLHVDPQNERFSLGLKQLADDPWDKINATYTEGTRHKGKVVAKNGAGAVVQLEKGIEGLIPEAEGGKDLKADEEFDVLVRQTNPKERRFMLSPAEPRSEEKAPPKGKKEKKEEKKEEEKKEEAGE